MERTGLKRTSLYVGGSSPGKMLEARFYHEDCVVNDLEDSVAADLYGATMTQADGGTAGKIGYKDTDSSAYLRFGFIVRRMKANKVQYKAIVYTKVMFDIPNEDYETKGETIVFKTNSVTGKLMRNKDRIWKITSLWVDTIDAAETFLDANVKPLTA